MKGPKGGGTMSGENELFKKTMKTLLSEKLSVREADLLKEEGFTLKNPTRKAAVMIALYKKATSGDLAAIKELCSIVCEQPAAQGTGRAVTIIDDIAD